MRDSVNFLLFCSVQ